MRRHIAYLKYVLRHKWYVFVACLEYGLVWRGIKHDWTKFLPSEWFAYARCFYKPDGSSQYLPSDEFSAAWNHHEKANDHHWQYWLLIWDHGGETALDMPMICRKEMIADWRGAGQALGKPNTWEWYEANRDKIRMHPNTRAWVENELSALKRWHEVDKYRPGAA